MADIAAQDRIVVGVDFGTTYSGVAEHYSGSAVQADDINVIKTWPGGNSQLSDKVPSEIAYSQANDEQSLAVKAANDGWSFLCDAFESKATIQKPVATPPKQSVQWGYQVRPEQPRLRCMKLLLDPTQDMPSFVSTSEMSELLAKSGKDATSAVTDYLREVYQHAQAEITKRYGVQFISTVKTVWVLTVPAVWSDTAKNATLMAAKQAGMGPELSMISEPEAAAVYTLSAIQPNQLQRGDNFVVVDAGGGTVDLISYEIKDSCPLRVEESVPGSGACCGAALLNMEFEAHVKALIGKASLEKMQRVKPKTWNIALNYFESHVKRNFDPDDMADFDVPFPGAADNLDAGLEDGFLTLSADAVSDMFKSTMVKILKLVDGQVEKLRQQGKHLAGVVLVGGFGQSRFLFKALKHHLPDEVQIMQPANAWTAVVRGAVLRGLENAEIVISRKARRHYGVTYTEDFIPGVHPKWCKEWDELSGTWSATNRMRWLVKKGDTLSSTQPIMSSWIQYLSSEDSKTIEEELIVCDDDYPPAGYDSRPRSSTKVLCRMPVNLEAVPAHLFKQHVKPSGGRQQTLDIDIGMQMQSGGLKFDLRVDGVVYGNIVAKFD